MSKLFNDWLFSQIEKSPDEEGFEPIITNYLINDNE